MFLGALFRTVRTLVISSFIKSKLIEKFNILLVVAPRIEGVYSAGSSLPWISDNSDNFK